MVKTAVELRASKAACLDGSFGAGKSHFMAVSHLLLAGNPEARSIPELGKPDQRSCGLDGSEEVPDGAIPHSGGRKYRIRAFKGLHGFGPEAVSGQTVSGVGDVHCTFAERGPVSGVDGRREVFRDPEPRGGRSW